MAVQKATQIRVKGNRVGIVGLQDVMESMKPDYSEQSDAVIGKYGVMGTPALVINKKLFPWEQSRKREKYVSGWKKQPYSKIL